MNANKINTNRKSTYVFAIGEKLEDKITGFTGVCTGRADYISGCNLYMLQSRAADPSKKEEPHWFDEPRLKSLGVNIIDESGPLDDRDAKTGADGVAPSK